MKNIPQTIRLETIRIVGNEFVAQPGIEKLKIKKTFKLGGGILGGCLKSGDVITVTDSRIDIDTMTFGTDITLNRLSDAFFVSNEYFKRK